MRARDEISAALPDADVRVEVCDVPISPVFVPSRLT